MKILHVVTSFGIGFPGGITRYVVNLANAQVEAGDEVIIADGDHSPGCEHDAPLVDRVGHIRLSDLKTRKFVLSKPGHSAIAGLVRLIQSENVDLVHFHLTEPFTDDDYEAIAKGILGVPYVVSLHDYFLICPRVTLMDYRDEPCKGPDHHRCTKCVGVLDQIDPLFRLSRKTHRVLPRVSSSRTEKRVVPISAFLANATFAHAVSTRVKEIFEAAIPNANYKVLLIGSDARPPEGWEHDFERGRKLRVSYIGTFSKHKGAELFLALSRMCSADLVEFHFYGRCDDSYRESLDSSAIVDHGSYAPTDMLAIMKNTDVGAVLPIWEDNGPQVAMEFINFGIPVIATAKGGLPDIVGRHFPLLTVGSTAEQTVQPIIRLLETISNDELGDWRNELPQLPTTLEHATSLRELIYEQ